MCGIAGILRVHTRPPSSTSSLPSNAEPIPDAWLDILDESITHRGPDAAGRYRGSGIRAAADNARVQVALVHRRLTVIDSATGAQPMVTTARQDWLAAPDANHNPRSRRSGEIAVVFNGCIYNHRALRAQLTELGHRFLTDHADTECIAHAYREWGLDAFRRLEGMFAIALWDAGTPNSDARLVLARDIAGEKPLYHAALQTSSHDALAFASSAAGLLRLCARVRHEHANENPHSADISEHALATWLSQGFGPEMPMWSIQEVDPAGIITDRDIVPASDAATPPGLELTNAHYRDDADPTAAWTDDDLPDHRDRRPRLTPELLDDLIGESVRARLDADVPLGCFLSGGTDSSLIASHAVRALGSLTTLNLRMPGSELDESEYARRVAAKLGATHITADADPTRAADDLQRLISRLGLPLGDSSLLAAHWISRAARDAGLRVALSGDGGDELFLGYDRYRAAQILRRWRWAIRFVPEWLAAIGARGSSHASHHARALRLVRAAKPSARSYPDLVAILQTQDMNALALRVHARPGFPGLSRSGIAGIAGGWFTHNAVLTDAPRWDYHNYLPQDLLRKTDTASMDVALEVRCPLLARPLIYAALREPASSLCRGGRKGLLREVARRHIDADIIDRPKRGFALPIAHWLRTPRSGIRELLFDRMASAEPFGPPWLGIDVNMGFVKRLIDEHESCRADHGQKLWTLLTTSLWTAWLAKACANDNPRA